MQASILIVSKNRKAALEKTLTVLQSLIDLSVHEVLVFLDGCMDESFLLKSQFDWVKWDSSEKSIGASPARNVLYEKAKGDILIGLDDDAHPLYVDFIERTVAVFEKNSNVGVLAFEEIKGVFNSDEEALAHHQEALEEYFCSEFVGCGFAIRKEVYEATNGFPVWIDIYGEESCVAIEVLAQGYAILYTNSIAVNHRVDRTMRMQMGRNYFRFGKQLKNTAFYYLVYYPFPFFKIAKLFWHNFKKYACSDWIYFKIYFQSMFEILIFLPRLMSYRNPIDSKILAKIRQLPSPKF
ncbi:glycosyltransferase family 2 protein [Flavobacterium sp. XS2P12]|uniref:glycosyltransferase family 2 protein n=1 Tax=Flavobacterium melibiosi TaxID=3398734 RepID=UPI003A846B86